MGEQENIALIQKVYDAFRRGDIPTILGNLSEDVEWTLEGPSVIPFTGKRRGIREVAGFFEALGTTLDNMSVTPAEFIGQVDKVITVGRFGATVKANGRAIDTAMAHVFTIANGRIIRFLDFVDTAQIADAYRGVDRD